MITVYPGGRLEYDEASRPPPPPAPLPLAAPASLPLANVTAVPLAPAFGSFAEHLRIRHGILLEAATAINLAAASAAIGAVRRIKNPLGGELSAALNVIVERGAEGSVRRAAQDALAPFHQRVAHKIRLHQEAGSRHRRQIRVELDQECLVSLSRLRNPPLKPQPPGTIPLTEAERAKEALAAALDEAEEVARRVREAEFEDKPFVVVDGITAKDIKEVATRSFDLGLFNLSPDGHALRQLQLMRVTEKRDVLRYLKCAWHGEAYHGGGIAILNPTVTGLWIVTPDEIAATFRDAAMVASGVLDTFLVIGGAGAVSQLESKTVDHDPGSWSRAINKLWTERINGEPFCHELAPEAAELFTGFCEKIRVRDGSNRFTAWWPENLLKIVLIVHAISSASDLPEIGPAIVNESIAVLEQLGAAQTRVTESLMNAPTIDAEISVMVAKVCLHGPIRKRDLFRRFSRQDYGKLEPVLARCCEQKLVRFENDLVYPAAQLAE